MTNLLRDGLLWLEQQRTAHMASPVDYVRTAETGQEVISVPATFGKTDYEVADDYGATVGATMVDFLILGCDLGFEPEAGDVIEADGRKYEVMNLSGEGCWRWSDPYRTTCRIHAKDIGAA